MPVYNTEKYLPKAIESVLKQTYRDFELLLIDDCSNDQSGLICDRYKKNDTRIQVIHLPQNVGVSNARNKGLNLACGTYIFFMDSDDFIENNLCLEVYSSLMKNKAQALLFGVVEDYYDREGNYKFSNTIVPQKKFYKDASSIRMDIIKLEEKTLYGYLWNKIYNLDYLRQYNFKFQANPPIDDIQFNVSVFMDISTLDVLEITPYHYAKRCGNSLTHKSIPDYFQRNEERVQMIFNQYQSWDMATREVRSSLAKIYTRYIFSALERNHDPQSNMTYCKQKEWLTYIYQSDLYCQLFPYVKFKIGAQNIMAFFLHHKMTSVCILIGFMLFFIKNEFPLIFSKAKRIR